MGVRRSTTKLGPAALTAVAFGLVCVAGGAASSLGGLHPTVRARVEAPGHEAEDPRTASLTSPATRHYEYVFPDGAMYVYDIDHGNRLVQRVSLPGVVGVRGVVASPRTHMLYISYGAFGGPGTTGRLLAYNLLTNAIVYNRSYDRGVDNMAIDPAGARIYMPDGELSHDGVWTVIAARAGNVVGTINGGLSPHETIVGLSGRSVYLGGRNWPYLEVASTATNRVFRRIGPLRSGVRPFTINGRESIAYTTATGFSGFQVSSIRTGRVLFTITLGHQLPMKSIFSTSSHGISLTPNERQIWVIDAPNDSVDVFDVSGVPTRRPRQVADIKLDYPLTSDGWVQMSSSGCFVYIGDSGDVISTESLRSVAFLPALTNTKESLEIDWRNGAPVATSTRTGLGYVTRGPDPPPPRCT